MRARWLLALLATGCIDTDAAVFVDAALVEPALAIAGSSLATGLGGDVTLTLHLGPRASGPSTSTLLAVSLVTADGQGTLASTLGFTSSPTLPTAVGVDDTVAVGLDFDPKDNALPASATATVCAGSVRLRAVVDDSLRGSPVTVDSEPFAVSGCP
ncbi:MAG: hypothetical protein FJ095_12030 [Deltaproteobacteria bacterium]|nr:hypothetical protein [Deltaproteobacteria bacterium]